MMAPILLLPVLSVCLSRVAISWAPWLSIVLNVGYVGYDCGLAGVVVRLVSRLRVLNGV